MGRTKSDTIKVVFYLFFLLSVTGSLLNAQSKCAYREWNPPYLYWLDAGAVPYSIFDSTLAQRVIDTSKENMLRYVRFGYPETSVTPACFCGPAWNRDTLSMHLVFTTSGKQWIRDRLFDSYWGVNPHIPFSQTRNMLSLENIRDTVLLRKRRGQYIKVKDLSHEIKVNVIENLPLAKRTPKPLINPKDSVTRWAFDITGGLNMAQTSLINWAAGGESSISGNGRINMNLAYRRGGHKWETKLNTEYGLVYNQTDKLNKTVDNLLLSTRYGYAIPGGRFYYTAYVEFQTQYDKGYANVGDVEYISDFLSPAYLSTSVGMEYKLGKLFSVYLAPASGRTTFVEDKFLSDKGAFGVDSGRHTKFEIGMTLTTAVEWKFRKNMVLKTDANFFTPYDRDFGNIVVDWNVYLEMRISKILRATIGTSLKYDDKVKTVDADGVERGPKVQFREMVTVGLGYTFKYKSKNLEY